WQQEQELAAAKLDRVILKRILARRKLPFSDRHFRRSRQGADRTVGIHMEGPGCPFGEKCAAASSGRGARALNLHRTRQRNLAPGRGCRRKLHPAFRSHRSQRLGTQERKYADCRSGKRETKWFGNRTSPSSATQILARCFRHAITILFLILVAVWKFLVSFPCAFDNYLQRLELRSPTEFFLNLF